MWNTPPSISMARGAAHRGVITRAIVISFALMLAAGLVPIATAQAAGHREPPTLKIVRPAPFDSDPLQLETQPLDLFASDDEAFVFTTPPGWTPPPGAPDQLGAFFIDACDSTGSSWLVAANGGSEPLDAILTDPAGDSSDPWTLPILSDDEAEAPDLFLQDPIPCDLLHPPRTERLPDITGTATYDGVGRRCSDFDADFVFRESKPGRGYDRYFLGNGQPNRAIFRDPSAYLDDSDVFDELHVFMAPDGPDGNLEGVVISGAPGTFPKRDRLARLYNRFLSLYGNLGRPEVPLTDALSRVRRNKLPRALLRDLRVKGSPCTYHVELDIDAGTDEGAFAELLDELTLPPPPTQLGDRFQVEVEWADGSGGAVPPATVTLGSDAADLPAGSLSPTFFSVSPQLLVEVLDACGFNEHFWVFAAATTDAEYTLTVTDTQSGESATYDSLADPSPAISDTSAFATCP